MAEAGGPTRVEVVVADNPGPLTLDGSRAYVLGRDACVVIDPGPALEDHLAAVAAATAGARPITIALTHGHPDHAGGTRELATRLGAAIAATPATARLAGLGPPDIALEAGASLSFDGGRLTVVAAPGHSPDHVCFHWPEARALFSGDVVLGEGTSMIAPPEGDMGDYLATLERLSELDVSIIYPGHGPPVTDPHAKIAAYIDHRRAREAQVLEALAAGARTPNEIRSRVYPDLPPALERAAEGSVRAHLEKLAREGRVTADAGVYAPRV